jgi:hypothetical protein
MIDDFLETLPNKSSSQARIEVMQEKYEIRPFNIDRFGQSDAILVVAVLALLIPID